jgi:hypothetical protein
MGDCRVLNVAPAVYQRVTRDWLKEERLLRLYCRSRVVEIRNSGRRVQEVTIQSPEGTLTIAPRAVIDATGNGSLVELIEPKDSCSAED